MVGMETVIVAGPTVGAWPGGEIEAAWVVDLPSSTVGQKNALYPSYALEPIYDGNDLVSWESCVWQPKSVRA